MSETAVRNATQLVELVCNTFGIDLHDQEPHVPAWRRKAIEAGKINAAIKRKPGLCTLENLVLTVEHCVRNDVKITAPYGLVYHVERALAEHRVEAARAARAKPAAGVALETTVRDAIEAERRRDDADSDYWIGRLTRASGPARQDVVDEWVTKRG